MPKPRTAKQPKQPKPNLVVSQGDGWRVEYSRADRDFVAIIDGVGPIGDCAKPHEAQTLINEYRYRQLCQVAA
jgi:hypothetical protein